MRIAHNSQICDNRDFKSSNICDLRDSILCEYRDYSHMTDPQHDIRLWMQEELRKRPHGTKGKLAAFLGVRADAVTRMMNTNPAKETREIKAHELPLITTFFEQNRSDVSVSDAKTTRIVRVAAYVQAGLFEETWEWNEDEQYSVSIPVDAELTPYRLFAAETRGPSMNKRWPEGTVVVFTNVAETMESPIPGKRYVIERKRCDGSAEHTVKTLIKTEDGKLWLMPESDDPRFQSPISVEDGTNDEDEVRIIGRIWYAVTQGSQRTGTDG